MWVVVAAPTLPVRGKVKVKLGGRIAVDGRRTGSATTVKAAHQMSDELGEKRE